MKKAFHANIPANKVADFIKLLSESSHEYIDYYVDGIQYTISPRISVVPVWDADTSTIIHYTPTYAPFDPTKVLTLATWVQPRYPNFNVPNSPSIKLLPPPFVSFFDRISAFTLHTYQTEFANTVRERAVRAILGGSKIKGIYLQDDAGLGKTVQAIEAALQVWDYTKVSKPVMVVVPKPLKEQWRSAIKAYVGNVKVTTIWDEDWANERRIFITHYEYVRDNYADLSETKWLLCIPDEAHRLRNLTTQLFEAFSELKKSVLYWIFMSATPFHKDPAEEWGVLNIIDPNHFDSYHRFQSTHTRYVSSGNFSSTAAGVLNPFALAKELQPYVIHRSYQEVASQVPPLIEVPVPIEMSAPQTKVYKAIRAGTAISFTGSPEDEILIRNVLSAIMKRLQITSYPAMSKIRANDVESAKLEWLDSFCDDRLEDEEQAIIFCHFRETAQMLTNRIRTKGISVGMMVGGQAEDNKTIDEMFKSGTLQMVVCVYETGGAGLDYPKCLYAVAYDLHWSVIQMYQAKHRVQRVSITRQKIFYYLICQGSIDELVYESVTSKWGDVALVHKFLTNQDTY